MRRAPAALGLAILIAAFISDRLIHYSPGLAASELNSTPPVYAHIRDGSTRPVLEIPVWPPSPPTFSYFYYQPLDWRPRLGGISSFFPPSFMRLRDNLDSCPSDSCLEFIGATDAATVVVHLSALDSKTADQWRAHTADFGPFQFVGAFGGALLWERLMLPPDVKTR